MTHITILLDEATEARLRQAAEEHDRSPEDIAFLTLAEGLHHAFVTREDDPGADLPAPHPDYARARAEAATGLLS
ncbi:hypothetical protein BJF92_12030 [Rhizobium rhizosphaerae]|uniref:CopG family transcriptional regulator n=1 Tax=Xaviernesmea rhizosphaerae TaxID=1672749 RepID=A0A1Q9AN19_9HYPH|nr:hypothetical protein [Xaviernesmea rhizosphaerae]OLP56794.1 hypothetical protein BJF92_12030 [Xaviernesmea rhizosphaerae]